MQLKCKYCRQPTTGVTARKKYCSARCRVAFNRLKQDSVTPQQGGTVSVEKPWMCNIHDMELVWCHSNKDHSKPGVG